MLKNLFRDFKVHVSGVFFFLFSFFLSFFLSFLPNSVAQLGKLPML